MLERAIEGADLVYMHMLWSPLLLQAADIVRQRRVAYAIIHDARCAEMRPYFAARGRPAF